jgi:pimeloyl-ACP methyl ester carboxylesterase
VVSLRFIICILFICCAASQSDAACAKLNFKELHAKFGVKPTAEETTCYSFEFTSKSLGRLIPVNVIVPKGYGFKNAPLMPYAIFLHGRGGDREQLIDLGAVASMNTLLAKGGKGFLIFALSGGDHYWVNAAVSGEKWGDMVVKDFVAFVEHEFRVPRNLPGSRALFGISMGGAGTLQLALHHPRQFDTVMASSPVFRREIDIWKPGSEIDEPHEDYDSFGSGTSYLDRSPRAICEKLKRADGTCLPFRNFRLDIGERDGMLDRYPDTRLFIHDLKITHPKFQIGIETCRDKNSTAENPDRDAHSYTYWRCQMPMYLSWISAQLTR